MTTHTIVIHLRNRSVIHGYYRSSDPMLVSGAEPTALPAQMTIEPADGSAPIAIRLEDAKAVFFVRSFAGSPTQQDVRFCDATTAHAYLWVRVTFTDGEVMEGRVSNGIDLLSQNSFRLFPVDELTNNRCLFVPKQSLRSFQVIGLLDDHGCNREVA
jgi:hypothetical protein